MLSFFRISRFGSSYQGFSKLLFIFGKNKREKFHFFGFFFLEQFVFVFWKLKKRILFGIIII